MRQFKDLLYLTVYIFLMLCVYNNQSKLAFICLIILSFVFIIKYQNIKSKNQNLHTVYKERLNHQRDCYINALNHDLRIPVIAQIRAIELFINENFGSLNEVQKDMINQMKQSCRLMLNLISLMINTYNMENGNTVLKYERFNISEIITSCFNELLKDAAEKNITLEYNGENKNLAVYADKEDIRKVIYNLLTTSVSYVSEGEKIRVVLKDINNKIQLSVLSGTTVNKKDCRIVNTQYTSVGESIRLLFCKRIIEIHKGHFIYSQSPNIFRFELPKMEALI